MQARDRVDHSFDPIERKLHGQARRAVLDLTKLLLKKIKDTANFRSLRLTK